MRVCVSVPCSAYSLPTACLLPGLLGGLGELITVGCVSIMGLLSLLPQFCHCNIVTLIQAGSNPGPNYTRILSPAAVGTRCL
ncbi:unnamed protein product [Caretta caretta]